MEFKLPELGEGVNEGELVKWKVRVGDVIKYDQPICEIMTDKATIEIPAPFEGKVLTLNAKEGKPVQVGQVMLTVEGGAAQVSAPSHHAASAPVVAPAPVVAKPSAAAPQVAAPAKAAPLAAPAVAEQVLAAPSTRRYAREAGIDLNTLTGTGPSGRIILEDVERAMKGPLGGARPMSSVPSSTRSSALLNPEAREERVPFAGLRKKIAEKMRQSKDKAAHFTYVEEADATELVKLKDHARALGEKHGIKVTYLPFVMKAMVAALREFPIVNSTLDEAAGEIVFKRYYNIGLSIQTEDGLTAPVVKNVEGKSILELAADIATLVDRARKKQLTREDFQGGTITLTNAGSIGGLFATPVINFPEVAIVGFNKIARKPVVQKINNREEIVIRDWTYFSISCDHRIVDGAVAAEFMKLFIKYIENPSLLLVDNSL